MKLLLKICFVILLFSSCSNNDEDNTENNSGISDENLSGIVFNEDFEAKGGKSWEDNGEIHINITNIEAGCDSDNFEYIYYVSTVVPLEIGVYENTNVVFHKKGETPMNNLDGTVEVVAITDTSIIVKIYAETSFLDDNHEIDGKYTISICK